MDGANFSNNSMSLIYGLVAMYHTLGGQDDGTCRTWLIPIIKAFHQQVLQNFIQQQSFTDAKDVRTMEFQP